MNNNDEKMLMSEADIKRFKRNRGFLTGVVCVALLKALCDQGIEICDRNIDHVNEYCPLNGILGIEHQIEKIDAIDGYSAYSLDTDYYVGDVLSKETTTPYTYETKDGSYPVAPEGYVLDGDMAVKTTISSDKINYVGDDAIVVTRNKDIMVTKTDNGDYKLSYEEVEPKIVKVLGRSLVLDIPMK